MKSKRRNITVNDMEFTYWCGWTDYLLVFISPKNNKNCKLMLRFEAKEPDIPIQHWWKFYAVNAIKNDEPCHLKVVEPRFIAQVINHLLDTSTAFEHQNETITYLAWDLLMDMGYTSASPDWVQKF